MEYIQALSTKDLVIGIESVLLLVCLLIIVRLHGACSKQKHKAPFPLITLENDYQKTTLCVCSIGQCYAQNIQVEEFGVVIHYNFDKTLTLKFLPVNFLKPNEKVPLTFKAFDDHHELDAATAKTLPLHLANATLEAHITYSNTEGMQFHANIEKTKDRFIIKENKRF